MAEGYGSFNRAKLELLLKKACSQYDSHQESMTAGNIYRIIFQAKLLILLERYDEACDLLLKLIRNETESENNSGEEDIRIPFYKILKTRKLENNTVLAKSITYLGGSYLRIGKIRTAFKAFDFCIEHIGGIEKKFEPNYNVWKLYCCAIAAKLSFYNPHLLKLYHKLSEKYVPEQIPVEKGIYYPLFIALLVLQYNHGNYDEVVRTVDLYWKRQKLLNIKPIYADGGNDEGDEWGTGNLIVTPSVLAIKAFALDNLGAINDAVNTIQEACDLLYKPENYSRFDSCDAFRTFHYLPEKPKRTIYDFLFADEPTIYLGGDVNWLWNDGALFEKNTQKERFLKLYLLFEDRVQYEPEMEDSYNDPGPAPKDLIKKVENFETEYGPNYISRFILAKDCYERKLFDQAVSLYTQSIDENDQFAYSLFWRGKAYAEINENEKALRDFNKAINMKPDLKYMRAARLKVMIKENRFRDAYDDLKHLQDVYSAYFRDLSYETISRVITEHRKSLLETQRKAQEQVLIDMSQAIKNKAVAVTDSLKNVISKNTHNNALINKALRGSELIRRIVDQLGHSFEGSGNDLREDVRSASETKSSVTINQLIMLSLENAIDNMFDAKYFAEFCHAYFPTKERYLVAKTGWEHIQHGKKYTGLLDFLRNKMISVEINDRIGTDKILISDKRSSPLRLTILFQEILLNAIKYASFVSRSQRYINIDISRDGDCLIIKVSNSFEEGKTARTTKVGQEIIANISKTLNADMTIFSDRKIHSVNLRIPFPFECICQG